MRRGPVAAFLVGAVAVAGVTLIALPMSHSGRTVPALLLVLPVLVTALVGGRTPSLAVAALAGLALATVFLPPIGSPAVRFGDDALALGVFLVVAFAVSALLAVTLDAERRRRAADDARLVALQQVDEHRRALLRSVSHELRTPLGIVHGTATELSAGEGIHGAPVRRRLLALLVNETGRLERIVANLLAMSRIDAGAWEPERELLDVGDVVSAAVHRMASLPGMPPVELEVKPDLPLVLADPVQLELVLVNLLENASRHSPDCEPIRVIAERDGTTVRIAIVDRGVGVHRDVGDRAFEPFVKGRGSTTTGIGLALCKTIVTEHGGTIRLEGAAEEGGTVAVVNLPAA
jgi:two-component system, OmpR family, sensor histidine kinase KdpD